MRYRTLGITELQVSEIGFGTWGLGGTSYGPVDDRESVRALKRAHELGINFYDTADLYGNGHSEVILRQALGSIRSKIYIATKGGTLPHSGFHMPQDFSPSYMRKALEASLSRLATDYVDLYQLHSPKLEDLTQELLETLETFRREGKVRHYGISVRSPKDGLAAMNKFQFSTVQANLNLIDHRAIECGLLDLCAKKNIGMIARTPLCFGFLTGGLSSQTTFADGDHRKLWPKAQQNRWANAVALFEQLYQARGETPALFALRFCLSQKAVSSVIPGMMNVREVEENAQAASLEPLTPHELEGVREIYAAHEFYDPSSKGI